MLAEMDSLSLHLHYSLTSLSRIDRAQIESDYPLKSSNFAPYLNPCGKSEADVNPWRWVEAPRVLLQFELLPRCHLPVLLILLAIELPLP